jgi:hypothetical protein
MTILSNREKKKLRRQLKIILGTLDSKHPVTQLYFRLTCNDIINGASDKEVNIGLHFFEELELYEECLGIHLAQQFANFFIFTVLINNYYENIADTKVCGELY